MKHAPYWLLAVAVLLAPSRGIGQDEALLANGGFETPRADGAGPAQWDRPDGLGVQWVEEPGHGRVIRLDTAVSEQEMVKQWQKVGLDDQWNIPKPAAGPVAATYGLSFYSRPVPVKSGQAYRIAFDFRGQGGAKVWVRGYGMRRASPQFKTTHIRDWSKWLALLAATREAPDTPGHLLWQCFAAETQAAIRARGAKHPVPPDLRHRVVKALNAWLPSREAHRQKAWQGVTLTGPDGELQQRAREGTLTRADTMRLNRYLCEAAWPALITPSRERRRLWETYVQCRTQGGAWHHFRQVFHPTRHRPAVSEMKVMLYAYWPPGVYCFDNLIIEPIDAAAYDAGKQAGTQIAIEE